MNLIVHCATETGFAAIPSQHHAVNIEGTANILAFALSVRWGNPPGLVHLSAAYVCGERSGLTGENELEVGHSFANGYKASKADAEALAAASGFRVAVARPSSVVGRSDIGRIGRFKNLYALLRLTGEGRIRVLPAAPGARLDLVPIDHVMYGLLDIIKHFEAAAGRTYHLASGDPILVSALVTRDYPGFHVLRIIEPAEFCSTALDPAESWLYHSVTSHFGCYLRPDPHFPPPRAIQGSESVLGITTTASSGKIVSA
jgi:nucleoside-diphosphate-sugar epimerase